jgi:hypothetical protein
LARGRGGVRDDAVAAAAAAGDATADEVGGRSTEAPLPSDRPRGLGFDPALAAAATVACRRPGRRHPLVGTARRRRRRK